MNTVLAQSATQLSVSNGSSDWDQSQFDASAERAGSRAAKKNSTTLERRMINRNKLVAAVCADYRAHFAAIYGKTDRLPSAVFEMVEKAADTYINKTLCQVNPSNALSYQRGFYHNSREMEITERVRLTGENKITLKEQLLGVHLFINALQKKIDNLPAAVDREKVKELQQQMMKLKMTESFIEGEIKHQTAAIQPENA